ncbi:MAG: hypothetical protein ABMB14_34615 [Myxococcota bacterium]
MLVLSLVSVAEASSWSRVPSLAELAERSRAVVVGEVVDAETTRCPTGYCTRYVIEVDEALAGDPESTVEVTLPGGHLDGLTQRYFGIPIWEPGVRVAVFVPREGAPQPLAGVFTVDDDALLVDPIARPEPVRSVDALARAITPR